MQSNQHSGESPETNSKNQDPRLSIYNARALDVVDSFLFTKASEHKPSISSHDEKQSALRQEETQLQAEVQKYRVLLDGDREHGEALKRPKEGVGEAFNQSTQLEDLKASEEQQKQFLQDFYKQMNIDAELEFAK